MFLKKKLFKNLTQLDLYSFSHRYWIEDLKNSKSLVSFVCVSHEECSQPAIITST